MFSVDEKTNEKYIKTRPKRVIKKDKFDEIFDGKTSYEKLINHENCTDGWKEIFNIWKEKGLIE